SAKVMVIIMAHMPQAGIVTRVTALHRCDSVISDKLPFAMKQEETVSGPYDEGFLEQALCCHINCAVAIVTSVLQKKAPAGEDRRALLASEGA
ncbi:MAG: hypothetical protein M3178_11690, partial [Pseudomonadota bacterium]|nr:hypothetical protein [Pseudomonadota bacterium]